MKISLIGTGKTGSRVQKLVEKSKQDQLWASFNSQTPLDLSRINQSDALILFVPGVAADQLLPQLSSVTCPIISGMTGTEFSSEFQKQTRHVWIQAHNFSLGMNLIKLLLENLGRAQSLFENPRYQLHEVHHTDKKDAPSGTALKWQEWLGLDAPISYERIDDVIGVHQLTCETPYERIELRHTSKNRDLFAAGALWAAQQAQDLPPGFYWFDQIVAKKLGFKNAQT